MSTAASPRSRLEAALRHGEFVVTGEINPPRTPRLDGVSKIAALYRDYVHAVNITDSPSAVVRMSPVVAARAVIDAGCEPVVQLTCRDRNRIALQADILGALALGVRNLSALSGDYVTLGDHPMARPVYDLDSVTLLEMVNRMRRRGEFYAQVPIQDSKKEGPVAPEFFLGAVINPFGDPLHFLPVRLQKKVMVGMDFVQTQCVFDLERFVEFMRLVRELGLHRRCFILAGIMPVKSAKPLVFMRDNVAGMRIPAELITRMEQAGDPATEGKRVALELISAVRNIEGVHGVHLMPLAWEAVLPELVDAAGLKPVPSGVASSPACHGADAESRFPLPA